MKITPQWFNNQILNVLKQIKELPESQVSKLLLHFFPELKGMAGFDRLVKNPFPEGQVYNLESLFYDKIVSFKNDTLSSTSNWDMVEDFINTPNQTMCDQWQLHITRLKQALEFEQKCNYFQTINGKYVWE